MPVDPRGNALIPTPGDEPDDANQFDPDGNQHELRSQFADPGRGFDGINEILKRLYRANICHRINVHYLCGNSWEDIQEFLEDEYIAGAGTVTDNAVPRFDGTTGLLLQNSGVILADTTNNISGLGTISLAAAVAATAPNIFAPGSSTYGIAVGATYVSLVTNGIARLSVAADGKVTIPGLLDPTGLEMTPVGANPGGVAGNTLWADSGAANRFKQGTNTLAYLSEVGTGDVTAASNITDDAIVRGDGGAKGVQSSGLIIDDVVFGALVARTANVTSANSDAITVRTGTTTTSGDSGNLTLEVGSAAGTHGAINIGTGNAESVAIGRSGKNTAVGGTLSSGATTETIADSVAGANFGVDATKGPYEIRYPRSLSTAGGGVAETFFDVPTVSDSAGEVFVQLECVRSTGALPFSFRGGVAFNNDGGTLTLGTPYTLNADDFGGGTTYAVTFVVSTTNVRVQITDNGVVVRCKAIVTRFHGNGAT